MGICSGQQSTQAIPMRSPFFNPSIRDHLSGKTFDLRYHDAD
jgi:hypothetical protein